MKHKFTLLFLFCLISLNLDASMYHVQTDKAIHIYLNPELPAVLSIPLEGFEFIEINKIYYEIDEKLGSYEVEQTYLRSSKNFRVIDVQTATNGVKIEFEVDLKKQKIKGEVLINENSKNPSLGFQQISITPKLLTEEHFNKISFNIPKQYQAVFGGGIQFSHCNLKGQSFPLLVEENGVGRGDKGPTFWANLLGAAGNEHTTYAPMPLFTTDDKVHYQCFSFDPNNFWEVDFQDPSKLSFSLNNLSSTAKTAASLIIKQVQNKDAVVLSNPNNNYYPELEDWMYQYILGIQGGKQKVNKTIQKLQTEGIKVGAIWIQDWVGKRQTSIGSRLQWDWRANEAVYPDLKGWIDSLHQENIQVLGYINPYFVEGGLQTIEGLEKGYFVHLEDNEPYKFAAGGFNAYMIDLNNKDAQIWMQNIIHENLVMNGFDGWMCDFGEWFPITGFRKDKAMQIMHNQFPQEWFTLNRNTAKANEKSFFIFNRSWFGNNNYYAPTMWLGDQMGNFGKNDGLGSAVNAYNSASLSGFPLVHSDIGGYTAIKLGPVKDLRDDEVLQRWIEMECFTPIWRSHEGLKPEDMSQIYQDKDMLQFFAYFDSIHHSLIPYFKEINQEIIAGDKASFVQHPFLLYPNDKNTLDIQYQFFVGDDLLVCPVVEQGDTKVWAYLPEGNWQHFFTKEVYLGGYWQEFEAPIGRPVVFWRVD